MDKVFLLQARWGRNRAVICTFTDYRLSQQVCRKFERRHPGVYFWVESVNSNVSLDPDKFEFNNWED